jgi:hypothetical protein
MLVLKIQSSNFKRILFEVRKILYESYRAPLMKGWALDHCDPCVYSDVGPWFFEEPHA